MSYTPLRTEVPGLARVQSSVAGTRGGGVEPHKIAIRNDEDDREAVQAALFAAGGKSGGRWMYNRQQHQQQQQQQEAASWSCGACTLVNPGSATRCSACGGPQSSAANIASPTPTVLRAVAPPAGVTLPPGAICTADGGVYDSNGKLLGHLKTSKPAAPSSPPVDTRPRIQTIPIPAGLKLPPNAVLAVDGTVYDGTTGKKLGHVNLPGAPAPVPSAATPTAVAPTPAPVTPSSRTSIITPAASVTSVTAQPAAAAATSLPSAREAAIALPPGTKLAPDGITVYDAATGRVVGHLQRKSTIAVPPAATTAAVTTPAKLAAPSSDGEAKRTPVHDSAPVSSSLPIQQGEPEGELPDDYFAPEGKSSTVASTPVATPAPTPAPVTVAASPSVVVQDPFSAAIAAGITAVPLSPSSASNPFGAITPAIFSAATTATPSPTSVGVVKRSSVMVAPAANWSTHFDAANNRHYYYESNTKTTTWIKPAELEQTAVPPPSTPAPVATAAAAIGAVPVTSCEGSVAPSPVPSLSVNTSSSASSGQSSFIAEPQTPISGGVTTFEPATPSAAVAVAKAEKDAKDAMTRATAISSGSSSSSSRSSLIAVTNGEGEAPAPSRGSMIDANGACKCHCHDITALCNHCGSQPAAAVGAIPTAPDIEDVISPRASINKGEKKDGNDVGDDEKEKEKIKRGSNHIIEGPKRDSLYHDYNAVIRLPPEYLEQLAAQRARHRKEMEALRVQLTADKVTAVEAAKKEAGEEIAKLQAMIAKLKASSS